MRHLLLLFLFFSLAVGTESIAQINYYCTDSDLIYETPENFRSGSLAEIYLTYQEMLEELDRMRSLYPDLISEKATIGDFRTEGTPNDSVTPSIGNNPIYWVKISKNPDIDEEEPEILYDSQIHGDEWGAMNQNIYYMWYLLENYEKDEKIAAILDNTELYFIPTLNVDGYLFSEFTYNKYGFVRGGRKNRKDAITDFEGVDINRNFTRYVNGDPTQGTWGLSDHPTLLTDPLSYSYAGTGPFSEVESRAYKWFVEQHEFIFNITAHNSTAGNGYSSSVIFPYFDMISQTPDHQYFLSYLQEASTINNFTFEHHATGGGAIGGKISDFNYGTVNTHSPIFSVLTETPSVGGNFIADSRERLDSINKEMLSFNLSIPQMALPFAIAKDIQNPFVGNSLKTQVTASIQRLGRGEGDFMVYIEPVSDNIVGNSTTVPIENLAILEKKEVSLDIKLSNNINFGDEITYHIVIDNGLYKTRKKVSKIFGKSTSTSFYKEGSLNNSFNVVGDTIWSSTENDPFTQPNAIIAKTENDSISYLTSKNPINLQGIDKAILKYQVKYDLQNEISFVQFQVSEDQETWNTLCGKLTKYNLSEQFKNQPGYYGNFIDWELEEIDLSTYSNKIIYYRFAFDPNPYNFEVHFLLDDITLDILDGRGDTSTNYILYPNPVSSLLHLETNQKNYDLYLYNILGQNVMEQKNSSYSQKFNMEAYTSGVYFLRIEKGDATHSFKIIKQ
ncbi:M14 family zinc carboxypeptidase [Rasiella sp. SM2506]|uniref:M14 family zinc carboxypeptidase n=1 Tax=Rasiella sp. SM2506 TaxID=3423914 RepID=UPI003D7AB183